MNDIALLRRPDCDSLGHLLEPTFPLSGWGGWLYRCERCGEHIPIAGGTWKPNNSLIAREDKA